MRCAQIWTAPAGWSSATGCCWRCWSGGCRVTRRTVSSRPQPRQYTGEGNRSGRACSTAAGSRPAIWTACSSTAITCDTSTRFWSGLGFLVVVSLRGPKGRSNPLLHRRVLATLQIWTANLRGPRQRGAPRNDCWEALTVSVESRITNHESREVLQTSLPLPLYGRGKVRDVYEAGEDLLIVATDRISAFDHVLPTRWRGWRSLRDCGTATPCRSRSLPRPRKPRPGTMRTSRTPISSRRSADPSRATCGSSASDCIRSRPLTRRCVV